MPIEQILQNRIAILDGAMATMIPPSSRPANGAAVDLLNLTAPELITSIHTRYLEAGADIILTNTFNSNAISMPRTSPIHELNRAGAKLARAAADAAAAADPGRPRFVGGCIGPTDRMASPQSSRLAPVHFDVLADAYEEQVRALLEGGVDLLMIETVFDSANARAALLACEGSFRRCGRRVPIMASVVLNDQGRTLSGETIQTLWNALSKTEILSLGINCGLGARRMRPYVEELARILPIYVSFHPSAGLPDEFGSYQETPVEMASTLREFAECGWINIAGGCCGTTPAHIRAAAAAMQGVAPRRFKSIE